jgi:hypothetical protein
MSLYQVRYLMSPNVTWVEFVAGERRSRDQDPAVFSSAGLLLLCLLLFPSCCLKPWEKKSAVVVSDQARWLRPMGDRGGGRDVSQWRANNAVTTRVSLLIRRIISRRHGTRWQTTVWLPALSSNEVRWAITIFSGTKTTTFICSPTTIFRLISFSIVTLSLAFLFKVYPKGKKSSLQLISPNVSQYN